MNVGMSDVIVWLMVGALAGTATGQMIRRRKEGFGYAQNLGVGMAGALLGGFLFDTLKLVESLDRISISLRDVVSVVVGALLFLAGLWAYRKSRVGKVVLPK